MHAHLLTSWSPGGLEYWGTIWNATRHLLRGASKLLYATTVLDIAAIAVKVSLSPSVPFLLPPPPHTYNATTVHDI